MSVLEISEDYRQDEQSRMMEHDQRAKKDDMANLEDDLEGTKEDLRLGPCILTPIGPGTRTQ